MTRTSGIQLLLAESGVDIMIDALVKHGAWNAVGFVVAEYNPIVTVVTDLAKEMAHRAVAHSLIWIGAKVFGFFAK